MAPVPGPEESRSSSRTPRRRAHRPLGAPQQPPRAPVAVLLPGGGQRGRVAAPALAHRDLDALRGRGQPEAPAAVAARATRARRAARPAPSAGLPLRSSSRTVPVTASSSRRIQPATTFEPAELATPSSSAAGRGRGQGSQTAACARPAWSSWRGGSGNATSPATAATTASPSHGSLRHSVQCRRSTASPRVALEHPRPQPPRVHEAGGGDQPDDTILTASSRP